MSKKFEIMTFSASREDYADKIINILDPSHKLVSHRLYRQHCARYNGICIKDLRIFGNRDIDDMIIVDNFCFSFALNLENGIPVVSYVGGQEDNELQFLAQKLSNIDDGESSIQFVFENFGLDQFYSFIEGGY